MEIVEKMKKYMLCPICDCPWRYTGPFDVEWAPNLFNGNENEDYLLSKLHRDRCPECNGLEEDD